MAKVREATIAKLKTLEKQKSEVEKTRDDIKYVLLPWFLLLTCTSIALVTVSSCLYIAIRLQKKPFYGYKACVLHECWM